MLHNECKDKLKHGDIVYICDYRFNNIDEQPIRHVQPQEVMVISNSELPKNKRVYYSEFHFRPIGKTGKPLSRIIAPYDNTGYRFNSGVSLNIFLTEKECVAHYKKQCKEIIKRFQKAKIDKIEYYDAKIRQIEEEIKQ